MHYKRLELKEPGPGYCHFPSAEHYDRKYFDGLTDEKAILKTDKKRVHSQGVGTRFNIAMNRSICEFTTLRQGYHWASIWSAA